ncbi:hypothetical protein D3C77_296030 [compost metagenome]
MLIFIECPHHFLKHHILRFTLLILRQISAQPFSHLLHKLLEADVFKRVVNHMISGRNDIHPILDLQRILTVVSKSVRVLLALKLSFLQCRIKEPAQIIVLSREQVSQPLYGQQRQTGHFFQAFQEHISRGQRIAVSLMRPIMFNAELGGNEA